jgi:hypothetical protein
MLDAEQASVVLVPIDDRDRLESGSRLPRHWPVAVP